MRSAKVLVAALVVLAAALGVASGMTAAGAAAAPARLTFLAATCPGSSSMYTRVAAGKDPNSNENGTAAAPSDISAYGCSPEDRDWLSSNWAAQHRVRSSSTRS
ncbi:MAG: hypothetical protein IPO51_04450 [Dehalococcoidia bacterium]|nr:hypothetical protein [Dehalococcoidia bacterium]